MPTDAGGPEEAIDNASVEGDERMRASSDAVPSAYTAIRSQMLPFSDLSSNQFELIVQVIPGGAQNIQDIYPLTSAQEGMLFHHMLEERGDTYLVSTLLEFQSRARFDEFVEAFGRVIARHDVLRTAVLWDQMPRPVQVVHRSATLPVKELLLDENRGLIEQLRERMESGSQRLDIRKAPLIQLQVAQDIGSKRWCALLLLHHIVCDAKSVGVLIAEVMAHLEGRASELPVPVQYRNHVARSLACAQSADAERFFRQKFGDISEPTAPFGVLEVHGTSDRIREARSALAPTLVVRLRAQARAQRVSTATLLHAAWAIVVSHTSRRDDVVYGTVLFGRLQSGDANRNKLGMFINALPLRLRLRGSTVRDLVAQTHRELLELFNHEQASLQSAQRCSRVADSMPLFTAILNYTHGSGSPDSEWTNSSVGIRMISSQARTNYPIGLAIADCGDEFALTVQTDSRIDPQRVLGYTSTAIQSLVEALEKSSGMAALEVSILPVNELNQVMNVFGASRAAREQFGSIQELRELWARRVSATAAPECLAADVRIYILDSERRPVPIGVMGELYFVGAQLSGGSVDPTQSEKLPPLPTPDPFSAAPHAQMCGTGTLARWRPDGTVELSSRLMPEAGFHRSMAEDVVLPQFEAPQGDIEEALARIWAEVLKVDHIGRDHNFFELGGHSLLSMKMLIEVGKQLSIQPPMGSIFRYPTIRQMAQLIACILPAGLTPSDSKQTELEQWTI